MHADAKALSLIIHSMGYRNSASITDLLIEVLDHSCASHSDPEEVAFQRTRMRSHNAQDILVAEEGGTVSDTRFAQILGMQSRSTVHHYPTSYASDNPAHRPESTAQWLRINMHQTSGMEQRPIDCIPYQLLWSFISPYLKRSLAINWSSLLKPSHGSWIQLKMAFGKSPPRAACQGMFSM